MTEAIHVRSRTGNIKAKQLTSHGALTAASFSGAVKVHGTSSASHAYLASVRAPVKGVIRVKTNCTMRSVASRIKFGVHLVDALAKHAHITASSVAGNVEVDVDDTFEGELDVRSVFRPAQVSGGNIRLTTDTIRHKHGYKDSDEGAAGQGTVEVRSVGGPATLNFLQPDEVFEQA